MSRTKRIVKKRTIWTKSDVSKLEEFIKSQSTSLKNNFYLNIKEMKKKCRKLPGFFKEMSEAINKSPEQCKSKFQKFEKMVYCKFLEIPKTHFELFNNLRIQKRSFLRSMQNIRLSNKNSKKNIFKINLNKEFKMLRNSILSESQKNSSSVNINIEDHADPLIVSSNFSLKNPNENNDAISSKSKNEKQSTLVSIRTIQIQDSSAVVLPSLDSKQSLIKPEQQNIIEKFQFEEESTKSFNISIAADKISDSFSFQEDSLENSLDIFTKDIFQI